MFKAFSNKSFSRTLFMCMHVSYCVVFFFFWLLLLRACYLDSYSAKTSSTSLLRINAKDCIYSMATMK
jgi:hypothetical protein